MNDSIQSLIIEFIIRHYFFVSPVENTAWQKDDKAISIFLAPSLRVATKGPLKLEVFVAIEGYCWSDKSAKNWWMKGKYCTCMYKANEFRPVLLLSPVCPHDVRRVLGSLKKDANLDYIVFTALYTQRVQTRLSATRLPWHHPYQKLLFWHMFRRSGLVRVGLRNSSIDGTYLT